MYRLLVYLLPFSLLAFVTVITKDVFIIGILIILSCILLIRWRVKFAFVICVSLLPIISYFSTNISKQNLTNNECRITHFENKTYLCQANINVIIYSDKTLEIGDWVRIEGEQLEFKNDNFNGNDLSLYYKSKNINYYFSYPDVKVLKKKESPKTNIYNILRANNDIQFSFIKMMIFNYIDDSNKDIYFKIKKLGLAHIVVISSMHVTFLFAGLFKVLSRIIKQKYAIIIIYIVLGFYGYLINFPISFVKAFLLTSSLIFIKNKVQKNIIISIIWTALLIYNPYLFFDVSFILTFGISYYIALVKNKSKKIMAIQIGVLSTLIQIALSYEFGLLNSFYQASVGIVILLSFAIVMIFPQLLSGVMTIIDEAYKNNIYITIGNVNPATTIIVILMILFVCSLVSKYKKITKISLVLITSIPPIILNRKILYEDYITFVNIGQGDCALVSINGKNFLIDAGGNYNKTTFNNTIEPYLKYEGIKNIESIFISHNDIDHSGSVEQIVQNFNVKNIVKGIEWSYKTFGNVVFKQLNNNLEGGNDSSQVIFFEWESKRILFLGDVSKSVEDIIATKVSDLDVVKVAHHGSSSSTSRSAFEKFKPKNSILSYGKNNFGHPSSEVIDTLEKVRTSHYHTYIHGAIKYYFKTGKIVTSNML